MSEICGGEIHPADSDTAADQENLLRLFFFGDRQQEFLEADFVAEILHHDVSAVVRIAVSFDHQLLGLSVARDEQAIVEVGFGGVLDAPVGGGVLGALGAVATGPAPTGLPLAGAEDVRSRARATRATSAATRAATPKAITRAVIRGTGLIRSGA